MCLIVISCPLAVPIKSAMTRRSLDVAIPGALSHISRVELRRVAANQWCLTQRTKCIGDFFAFLVMFSISLMASAGAFWASKINFAGRMWAVGSMVIHCWRQQSMSILDHSPFAVQISESGRGNSPPCRCIFWNALVDF